ncbi:MAG: glycosyltransferase family 4 protein [Muribaculaceae bacterium]|nr:glycosyltransferase family 4 protein [Muribaculaceae bacterium]
MKIGFDAKRAILNDTGLGNYSRRVIEELSESMPDSELILYTPYTRADKPMIDSRTNVSIHLPDSTVWRKASAIWRIGRGLTGQLKRDGIDLYHGLSNELPLDIHRSGIPSVVTIHDVIFRRCPDNYNAPDRLIYDYKFSRAARNATRVIAISECTKRDIVSLYGVNPDKIDVIYQSCDPSFAAPLSEADIQRVKQAYSLPDRFIAMVGTLEPRKNQMLAVRALRHIDPEVHLVIAGRPRRDYGSQIEREILRQGVSDRVHLLSGIPFKDLPAMYRCAEITAYTSRYEGFGLPVVEAISAGTPVIAATGSCLEEAGGAGGVYVDPDDYMGFAEAANRLLQSVTLRDDMVRHGREHIARISSTPMHQAIMHTYHKAMEAFG